MTDTETETIVWKGNEAMRPLLVPIADLRPHPSNPRRHDLAAIASSLGRFGQQRPVLARDGQLIAGHGTTLAAAEKLGWTHVAVIPSDLEGDAEIRDFLLADNRTHDLGHYETEALADLVRQSIEDGTLEGTGYTEDDAERLLADLARDPGPPADPDPADDRARDELRRAGVALREIVLTLSEEQHERLTTSVRILRRELGTDGVIETIYQTVIRAAQNPEALRGPDA